MDRASVDDQITIGDNGLYQPNAAGPNWGSGNTPGNRRGSTLYTYSFDGIHPTPETAKQIAEWVVSLVGL